MTKGYTVLARMMTEQGITPQILADTMGVSKATVYNWAHGRTIPYRRVQQEIALVLGRKREEVFPVERARTKISGGRNKPQRPTLEER